MPYVICSNCELESYTAARFSTVDECGRCGSPLSGAARRGGWGRDPGWSIQAPAEMGRVSAFTKSSSWFVVQHS
jgi:hypothetical protein